MSDNLKLKWYSLRVIIPAFAFMSVAIAAYAQSLQCRVYTYPACPSSNSGHQCFRLNPPAYVGGVPYNWLGKTIPGSVLRTSYSSTASYPPPTWYSQMTGPMNIMNSYTIYDSLWNGTGFCISPAIALSTKTASQSCVFYYLYGVCP